MAQTEYFRLEGGLDLTTSALAKRAGAAIFGLNYEVDINGGYRRVAGYERFDGRAKPSGAAFIGIDFVANTGEDGEIPWVSGMLITGQTSGATGTLYSIAAKPPGASGYSVGPFTDEYDADADYMGVFVLLSVSGTFQDGEEVLGPGGESATLDSGEQSNYTVINAQYLDALAAAADVRRALIDEVPGTGPVRGVFRHGDKVYAFRDYDGSEKRLYESSSSGWAQVELGAIVHFDAGLAAQIELGDTIQDPSAGTGTVLAVVVTSGTWAGNDAAGYLIYSGAATFADNDDIDVGGALNATANGASAAQTLSPGGLCETIEHNFFGAAGSKKIYGCDGVNNAFQFDGTAYVPIFTGMPADTPEHIGEHATRLALSFPGGSLQLSSVGEPLLWNALLGATEIGLGDEITALTKAADEVLVVFGRNITKGLYGLTTDEFELRTISPTTGALPNTVKPLTQITYLDDRGITNLVAVQNFGNFAAATLSRVIAPMLLTKRGNERCAVVVRERGVYRLFYSDKSAVSMTFNGDRLAGFLQQSYGFAAFCAWSGENQTGREEVYIGADDGFVYQMEAGYSFDGESIEHSLRLAFNHSRSPRQRKRYRLVELELETPVEVVLRIKPDFGYSSEDFPVADPVDAAISSGGAFWDAALWGEFRWSAQSVATAQARIDGTAANMSLLVAGSQKAPPHVLQGAILHFAPRRQER